jgi:CubicO group peptidase (beta-lactamase class C family)
MKFAPWLLVAGSVALLAAAQTQPRDARRNLVELSLAPAVVLAGEPSRTKTLAAEMRHLAVPGVSIAVIDHAAIAWVEGYGATSKEGAPVTPSTRFQAGSISKAITALGVLRAAAAGTVSLDRPVNDYLTSWKLPDGEKGHASEVTLRRLLSHTAGLNVQFFPGYEIDGPQPGVVDILDGRPPANTSAIRITAAPGSEWRYSGGGYLVAQQVVTDVSREPFALWAKQAILDPATMAESSFDPPSGGLYALGHLAGGKPVPGGYHLYPEGAAAGLWTTPTDLAHALLALSASIAGEPRAILPQAIARIVLDPVFPGESVGFDTGGSEANRWIAKGGDTNGFAAYMVLYPSRGQGAVVMTNSAAGSTLARDVMRGIAQAYHWPDFGPRTRRAVPFDQEHLTHLPGTYRYQGNNAFIIARAGKGLTIADPGEAPERLYIDQSGKLFTLSQDLDYVFGTNGDGEIHIGHAVISFMKSDHSVAN